MSIPMEDKIDEALKLWRKRILQSVHENLEIVQDVIMETITEAELHDNYGPELKARIRFIGFDTAGLIRSLDDHTAKINQLVDMYVKLDGDA